jgi:hypothetical protein
VKKTRQRKARRVFRAKWPPVRVKKTRQRKARRVFERSGRRFA